MDAISIITFVIIGLIVAAVIWQVRQRPFVNIPEPDEAEKNLPAEYYYPELQEPAVAEAIEEPVVEVKEPVAAKKAAKKPAAKAAKKSTTRKPKAQ